MLYFPTPGVQNDLSTPSKVYHCIRPGKLDLLFLYPNLHVMLPRHLTTQKCLLLESRGLIDDKH